MSKLSEETLVDTPKNKKKKFKKFLLIMIPLLLICAALFAVYMFLNKNSYKIEADRVVPTRTAVYVLNDDGTVDVIETNYDTAYGIDASIYDDLEFEMPDNEEIKEWNNIIKLCVAENMGYTCVVGLKKDGTVVVSGNINDISAAEEWKNIKDICCPYYGDNVVFGLTKNGTIVCTDSTSSKKNRRIVSTDDSDYVEEKIWKDWKDVKKIDAGAGLTALRKDGTVLDTGHISTTNYSSRGDVEEWNDIVQISNGMWVTVGLKKDGTVVAAGIDDGRLDVEDWTNVTKVECTKVSLRGFLNAATFGIKEDGTVYATGSIHPEAIMTIESWTDVKDIACGLNYIVALKNDGTVEVADYECEYSETYLCSDDSHFVDYSDWENIEEIYVLDWYIVGVKSDGTMISNFEPLNENLSGYKIK